MQAHTAPASYKCSSTLVHTSFFLTSTVWSGKNTHYKYTSHGGVERQTPSLRQKLDGDSVWGGVFMKEDRWQDKLQWEKKKQRKTNRGERETVWLVLKFSSAWTFSQSQASAWSSLSKTVIISVPLLSLHLSFSLSAVSRVYNELSPM